jgi:hypothetical protein
MRTSTERHHDLPANHGEEALPAEKTHHATLRRIPDPHENQSSILHRMAAADGTQATTSNRLHKGSALPCGAAYHNPIAAGNLF